MPITYNWHWQQEYTKVPHFGNAQYLAQICSDRCYKAAVSYSCLVAPICNLRELNLTAQSFDAPQQHLYSGLVHPVDYSIYAQRWIICLWASSCYAAYRISGSTQQTWKVVQYVNKVGKKFYARKKVLSFVLNPPQDRGGGTLIQ